MQGEILPSDADKLTDTLTNFRLEVIDRLSRLETKLDRVEDHESRIRKLERLIWVSAGVAAAAGNADTLVKLLGY